MAVKGTPSHSSLAIMGSHSVACYLTYVNTPHLNPNQTNWYSIYLPGKDGLISLGDWLYTEMVYPPTDNHIRLTKLIWNTLPEDVTSSQSEYTFRRQLKTWFFKKSFPDMTV